MTTTRQIRVQVEPAYTVQVGTGLLEGVGTVFGPRSLALIADAHVSSHYGAQVAGALARGGAKVTRLEIEPGEQSKAPGTWARLLQQMAVAGIDRSGGVVALGGGIVGDVAGFVAASYMRGLPWLQLPTSLLAMVDASVGGKTAINLPEGKNLVGAFWQPVAVIADVDTLATLPEREFRQGGAELFKHGMLADPSLLELFEADFDGHASHDVLVDAVARSVAIKATVVAQDEHEHGVRAHLNLGHSLAHALEGVSHHALPHGDAVAYGILFAVLLSRQRGWTDLRSHARTLLRWARPQALPDVNLAELAPFLARDKKNVGGTRRFVLLRDLAQPVVVDDVSDEELERAWRQLREEIHDLGSERT